MNVVEIFYEKMKNCDLCPRRCRVNRMEGQKGYCGVDGKPMVSSYFAHHGEESVKRPRPKCRGLWMLI